jgi:short-subunit dehydrogenase
VQRHAGGYNGGVNLRGAVCLVTGASSGIGAATARALSSRGAVVLVAGTDAGRTASVAAEVRGTALVHDLRDPGGPGALADAAAAAAGRVDVLVNNAGIGWAGAFETMPEEEIAALVAVDLQAAMLLTRRLLPAMVAGGRGHVVSVGSVAGHAGGRNEAVYAGCKAGLAAFTEALRQEHAGSGVGFSIVIPGPVATPFFDRRGTPYGRSRPRPVAAGRVAAAIVEAVRRERPQVTVPAWLELPIRIRGAAPEAYRPLVDRFG